jgi:hypothetical protein
LWLITRRQNRKDLPIRTVADYLAKIFVDERELFEESPDDRATDRAGAGRTESTAGGTSSMPKRSTKRRGRGPGQTSQIS